MKKYILSIETVFEGGSLSLISQDGLVEEWRGDRKISKAEDILEQISILLKRNDLKKEYINLLVISLGGGSSTGEKIGQSIAKGLGKSIGCGILEVPIYKALLSEISEKKSDLYLIIIPAGLKGFSAQLVRETNLFPEIIKTGIFSINDILDLIATNPKLNLILAGKADEKLFTGISDLTITNMNANYLSTYCGNFALSQFKDASDNEVF